MPVILTHTTTKHSVLSFLMHSVVLCSTTEKIKKMANKKLDQTIRIRIEKDLKEDIKAVAEKNKIRPSTFARIVLAKHLPDYRHDGFIL